MKFLQEFISFFTFSEPNVKVVFLGSLILCGISGLVGTFTLLRKRSLIGDVISHSVLPGIALAFILGEQKNVVYLIIGATITGWISIHLVDYITRVSKIKSDTAIALILSVFFGLGVLLLTHIQHTGNATQSGLDQFIFGRASAMNMDDVYLFAISGVIVAVVYVILFRAFSVLSFDESYAQSIGFPLPWLKLILSVTTVVTVAMGVQAVGVVLMSALLITPAAAARFWTHKIHTMAILAIVFSAISGVVGSAISYTYQGMPTGPWIVVVISIMAFASALFGAQSGLYKAYKLRKGNNAKIRRENTIKIFYQITGGKKTDQKFQFQELIEFSEMQRSILSTGLSEIKKLGWLKGNMRDGFKVTDLGFTEAKAIVRKHRLWELYISKYMHLQPDHVHDDAEGIEHVITPEIEKELEELLDFPTRDPHDSEIPY